MLAPPISDLPPELRQQCLLEATQPEPAETADSDTSAIRHDSQPAPPPVGLPGPPERRLIAGDEMTYCQDQPLCDISIFRTCSSLATYERSSGPSFTVIHGVRVVYITRRQAHTS